MNTTFAFVTYESSYAPCGGIQAVMQHLPDAMRKESQQPTVMITPFHHRIAGTTSLKLRSIGTVLIPVGRRDVPVAVLKLNGATPIYFLRPDDLAYFAGEKHPYDVPTGNGGEENILLRDSLFFGAAAVEALALIAPRKRFTLMMQDWEAATCALALAGRRHHHKLFVTLHNSYDSPAPGNMLRDLGIPPSACRGWTVLQRALPLVGKAIFTVSDQFAVDFREDPLQNTVMAPHLQRYLQSRLRGVCNGPFMKLKVERELLSAARKGVFKPLQSWKLRQRTKALRALAKVKSSDATPVWGDPQAFGGHVAPWFVFAGRDDSRQKGYDVAVAAIRTFLRKRRDAQFLFFPIPGDEGVRGLGFLRKLATGYPENVIAFPFRWGEGFGASLAGAAYGVMPSLYEPFGMASEFYLNGTVGLARATGGLCQQIRPLTGISSFSGAAAEQAAPYFAERAPATGLLFREAADLPSVVEDWRAINAAGYNTQPGRNRVKERGELPLFAAMAGELQGAMVDALDVLNEDPALYHRMLAGGCSLVQRNFSWRKAAREYLAGILER
ncbi:MAG: hypothetical protein GY835_13825 [bacterium]|nr:hypothetical protein [bacterium]